jgi:thiamine pyrophosphokinase
MQIDSVALVANGKIPNPTNLASKIQTYPYLIAVDGGLNSCFALGLSPNLIIGDLDSAKSEVISLFEKIPRKTFPPDKDKTDLELAIDHALELGAKRMTVFGALGGRSDHLIFNAHLLARHPGKLFFENDDELLFVINKKVELTCRVGQTLSLLPLNGPVTGITTQGLKWELKNGKLDKYFMGISNLVLQPHVTIEVGEGDLLCALSV